MNRLHQNTGLFLILGCLGGTVFGGLLPGGPGGASGNGYQYNRPGGAGGFGGNGFATNGRPSSSYGVPGFGGGFGTQGLNGGGGFGSGTGGFGGPAGFGGRPSANYGAPGFGGNVGFQGIIGGVNGYQGGSRGNAGYNYNDDNGRPRPYSFEYEVRDPPSGNNYGQQESSDGNTVRGEYRVLLPDSRTQIVRYTADDSSGYNADVQYEGQAQFPQGGGFGGYNQGGGNVQGGFGGGNGGGYRGGGAGIGIGNGNGFSGNSNQYLPPGVDHGK